MSGPNGSGKFCGIAKYRVFSFVVCVAC